MGMHPISKKQAWHGFINFHKPIGLTSADAVNRVKRLVRPTKIGHAGTLDPLATGVLPLALGEGTKCINLLMDAKKTYEFSVTFGQRRATDDAEGEVIATSTHMPTEAEILAILPRFTGEISQTPPIYSALKVDGKRAYDLARAGEEVALAARPVTIYTLEFLGISEEAVSVAPPLRGSQISPATNAQMKRSADGEIWWGGSPDDNPQRMSLPNVTPHQIASQTSGLQDDLAPPQGGSYRASLADGVQTLAMRRNTAHFRAVVSKGTYIRSLGRDLAQALGTEGYISKLHRAAVGPFTDNEAISLDFLEESVHKAAPPTGQPAWLTPLERALDDIPAVSIDGGQLTCLRHGQRVLLTTPLPDALQIAVLHQGKLVALAKAEGNQVIPTRLLVF